MAGPARSDVALAALLAVLAEVELHTSYAFERQPQDGPDWAYAVLFALAAGAIAWRRIQPLLVSPFITGVFAVMAIALAWPNIYAPMALETVAAYSLVVYAPSLRATAAPGAAVLVLGIPIAWGDPEDPVGSLVTFLLLVTGIWAVGAVVRRQRHRADSASRERDVAQKRAREIAASERARIARELHDVVAHGMSVVVLQARGGRRMIDTDPGQARGALDDIERVASECLDEMRRLLGILRGGETAPLAPQPKLRELESLVTQARRSGAAVDLHIEGEPRELPPAVELSVYRIAQEALTNSLKHAPGSRAQLQIVYGDSTVTVIACDDGPGGTTGGEGHGLIGMRERVDLFGGTFSAGAQVDGGFAVRAILPLEPAT